MAITINPGVTINPGLIVGRPSLILYLDAANPRSYPGTGGTWYDLSGYGRHATLVNVPTFTGNAFDFNYASSQFAVIQPSQMFNGDMTAIGWVYVRTYQNWSRLFDFGNGSGGDNVIIAISEGSYGLPVYSTTGNDNINSGQTLPLNQWVQLAAVQTGSTGILYMNGAQVATSANTPIASDIRNYNYIGRSNWVSDAYLDGKVSSLKIYNRALSSDEITQDFNSNSPA
jgi:hypothetical protein